MLGRTSGTKAKVTNAAETVAGYVDPLVKDEKLRRRLLEALAVGVAARQRARRQIGVTSLARRLGSDPVLRQQVAEIAMHLRDAREQVKRDLPVKRSKSHRARNTTLLIVGIGLIVASKPTLREKIAAKAKSFMGEGQDDMPPEPSFTPPAPAQSDGSAAVGGDAPA
jgi:hypothetical protein